MHKPSSWHWAVQLPASQFFAPFRPKLHLRSQCYPFLVSLNLSNRITDTGHIIAVEYIQGEWSGAPDLGDVIGRVAHKPVGNQSVRFSQNMFGMSWGNGCSKQTLNQKLATGTERSKVTCDKPTLILKAGDSHDTTGRRQNIKRITRQQLKGMASQQEFGKGAKRQIPWWY